MAIIHIIRNGKHAQAMSVDSCLALMQKRPGDAYF